MRKLSIRPSNTARGAYYLARQAATELRAEGTPATGDAILARAKDIVAEVGYA